MIKQTEWSALFSTNFLGVLNDNFLKNLVCFVSIGWLAKEHQSHIIMIASALLVAPYLLFSPLAGKLAKTQLKTSIVRIAKAMELCIMFIACMGFVFESIYCVMAAIFFMGLQSCMFSPSKYGLIRDIGGYEGISFGTGSMEMLTFLGVLLGTFFASLISDHFYLYFVCLLFMSIAALGWFASTKIKANESTPVKNCDDTVNPVIFLKDSFYTARQTRGLNYVVLSLCIFWFIGSMVQMTMIVHCPNNLGMSNTATGGVMSLAAVGIGLGCYLSGVLSGSKVELGLVPIGGIGISICMSLIFLLHADGFVFSALIFSTAFFSGFFKVPLNSWIQDNVKGRDLGEMIAYTNMLTFLFIFFSAGVFGLMGNFHTEYIFLLLAITAITITCVSLWKIPKMLSRLKSLAKR